MAKPVIFVIGASGNVGSATVETLSSKYANKVEIRAGVRNPDKAQSQKLEELTGVTVVKAEMGPDSKDELVATLRGVNALFIVTPSCENRAQLAVATAEAAKEAGVEFILVVSVLTSGTDTIFGRQFAEIESTISSLGVPYAFLRLLFFYENHFLFKQSIVSQSAIHCAVDPNKPHTAVAIGDAAKAAAAILADPFKHANKTYKIVSDRHTHGDVAAAFSAALGREIKYVQVSKDAVMQCFSEMGVPEWRQEGILELYQLLEQDSLITNEPDLTQFTQITGEKPTDIKTWVSQTAGAFQA